MSRNVAALYNSRAEAELARNRLVSGVKAKSVRIIARDTVGAVDGLSIDPKTKANYRDAVGAGSHLLVAELPSGTKPQHVVGLLDVVVTNRPAEWPPAQLPNQPVADGQPAFEVADEPREAPQPASLAPAPTPPLAAVKPSAPAVVSKPPAAAAAVEPPVPAAAPKPAAPAAAVAPRVPAAPEGTAETVADEERVPVVSEELRVGKREVTRGGARLRSFTRESPAEEQVTLQEEIVDVESRPSERRLTDSEVEAGGLFKERVIDIAEMREEPVVTKMAVVREEVIVRKRVTERVETVRDTVRRTQIEVEDLAAPEPAESGPRFLKNRGKREH